jgi:hypothetical protein
MKRKVLVAVIYTLFMVALFEGGARFALSYLYESHQLWEHDYGWRQSWIKRHQSTGKDVYYKFDEYDPTKGWISKPNLRDMRVFDDKILNTTSKGFRGMREHSYDISGDVTRIVLLGDSFTFGDEVSDDEVYARYLQDMLPGAEIINLGVHGYGHDQMLILLEEEGVRYSPDIVIIGFLPMDMLRNMLAFRDFAKPIYRLDGELVLDNVPVPTPDEVLKYDWLRPRFIDLFSVLHHFTREKLGLYDREMEQKTTALLEQMVEISSEAGAIPVIVFLPAESDITADPEPRPGELFLFSACAEIEKAACFSARPRFAEKLSSGVKMKLTGHWDAAGHQTVAESIRDYLLENEYLEQ